ncbi:MAG: thermonuclease family protein [Actinomycetota bacterium]|nr:thermonuclease family protein [Actinomycetota bacterium]
MPRRAAFVVLVCIITLCACGRAGSAPPEGATDAAPSPGRPGSPATLVRVVDGDTVVVHISGRDERVRLIGIDTPESVKPNTPVQCFAAEASGRTKDLLPVGTRVRLERDAELRDRYKRLLAYVFREPDGLFVNLALTREGFALPYTFPPNVAHADDFLAAATEAREAHRGLWNRCRDPAAPIDPTRGAR